PVHDLRRHGLLPARGGHRLRRPRGARDLGHAPALRPDRHRRDGPAAAPVAGGPARARSGRHGAVTPPGRGTGFDPILFDLDGTVVDSVALIRESHRHAVRTVLGEEWEDERLVANVGRPLREQMAAFSPERSEELYRV